MNRGPTIVIGYLCLESGWTLLDAFARATSVRGMVLTNEDFRKKLAAAWLAKSRAAASGASAEDAPAKGWPKPPFCSRRRADRSHHSHVPVAHCHPVQVCSFVRAANKSGLRAHGHVFHTLLRAPRIT